ncbi:hypothetical protein [Rubritalea tangerina]|uniref:hypothetical protein n=1 Tax=Rubritalea tangerina TaxID=430798 RepID=UPI003621AECD
MIVLLSIIFVSFVGSCLKKSVRNYTEDSLSMYVHTAAILIADTTVLRFKNKTI